MVNGTAIPPRTRDLLLRLGPALDVATCVPITHAGQRLRTGAVDRVVLLHCSGAVRRRLELAGMQECFHFPRPRPTPVASRGSAPPTRHAGVDRVPWAPRRAPPSVSPAVHGRVPG